MKKDEDLQKDVLDAINWEPSLIPATIGVSATAGIVTLTGTVDSYFKKSIAEYAAKNVAGVKALVEDIEVHFGTILHKNDKEIAEEIMKALGSDWDVPTDKVIVKVESGWVTLEGSVAWNYEKEAAKAAIINLPGINGITNNIIIKSYTNDYIEKLDIKQALGRNWALEHQKIDVKVDGNRVTLGGTVRSLYEWDEAERIAWKSKGVTAVHNELLVVEKD